MTFHVEQRTINGNEVYGVIQPPKKIFCICERKDYADIITECLNKMYYYHTDFDERFKQSWENDNTPRCQCGGRLWDYAPPYCSTPNRHIQKPHM